MGLRHISQPCGAVVCQIAAVVVLVDLPERVIPWALHLGFTARQGHFNRAAKEVGVGHIQRAFGAIKFEMVALMVPDIPRGRQVDGRARVKLQQGVDVGRGLDRDLLALARARSDRAFGFGRGCQSAHTLHRPQKVDQRGDVIGSHVHNRASAGLVEELGRGVPAFGPVGLNGGIACGDLTNRALVQNGAGLLMRAAQKRIGRTADRQALGLGQITQGRSLFQRQHQRLFGIGVLARFQYAFGDGVMRIGDREVDHDVQCGVGEQVIHALRFDVELCRAGLGRVHIDIRHSADL